jgi:hypothetical protein
MTTVLDYQRAVKAKRKAIKDNAPIKAKNAEIRRLNRKLKDGIDFQSKENEERRRRAYDAAKIKILPNIVKVPRWANKILQEETNNRIALTKRIGSEWKIEVDKVNNRMKRGVASIVWWDYFSNRGDPKKPPAPWYDLDDIVLDSQSIIPEDDQALIAGLELVGYSPIHALKRSIPQ